MHAVLENYSLIISYYFKYKELYRGDNLYIRDE